nr:IS1249 family transposase [Bifidobacterium saguini]
MRWRCRNADCGSSRTQPRDNSARDLRCGLDWLFSKRSQAEHRLSARTLRRRCELMWSLWAPVPLVDEIHHVVHVDGFHLHRDAVVLIAVAGGHVIGWHIARSERSAAWERLMARIAPPDVLVCDGGGGVLKAARTMWPDTRIQRCLFHVQANVFGLTGMRPRLEAGRRLRRIAVALARVRNKDDAAAWLVSYNQWEQDFAGFLDEQSRYADGSMNDTHQRLVKARRMIRRRIREDQLFTFLDEEPAAAGPVPSTNNLIESWNSRLRDMLRHHRGLRLIRQLKAICWWCHQHTEHHETDAWLAANAITDERLEELYKHAWEQSPQGLYDTFGIPMRYGTGIDWNDFHTRVKWQSNN